MKEAPRETTNEVSPTEIVEEVQMTPLEEIPEAGEAFSEKLSS
jgi:hypothetical protein